ncbi:amidohydrolase family protein [Chromobacterium sp. TRC.1.1.SA]|uniref:6-methylsalicylate decarboxylase n=1 Tax=Chromobacterium indicum TaxID=3110228 RepID=A0ABV0CHN8_9NEIS
MTATQRIDVHQHVVPPFWAEALPAHGGDPSGWKSPEWSPQSAIAFMDSQGIATGVLSLTATGVQGWSGQSKRDMARRVNEYTAGLVEHRPDRFGHFATVSLPDIEGSLREIEFAFDALKADGVVLLSNYGGQYLGDPGFEPVWAELNRRRATVFIHPGKPAIDAIAGMPGPLVDYPFDTTRTAVQMVLNGTLARHPDVNVILSHAGGFLPYASHRFAELAPGVRNDVPATEELLRLFQRFYFDTALASARVALPSLTAFSGIGRILYGSDYPYAPAAVRASFTAQLDACAELSPAEHAAINRRNALALFSRLAKVDSARP